MGRLNTTYRMPLDVILEILVWLPAKSALRFKCVCKEWCNLIDSPPFAKLNLEKSLKPDSQHNRTLFYTSTLIFVDDFLYQPVKVTKLNWPKDTIGDYCYNCTIGSCNGLICNKVISRNRTYCDMCSVKSFLIFNPTTRNFKLILPPSEKIWKAYSLSYGFGYDSDHDDYKIVVSNKIWTKSDRRVFIYSLKTDLWSCRTPPPRVSYARSENENKIIFCNNMLHYLASTDGGYRIARFDITSENWKDDLSLPAHVNEGIYSVHLGELEGRLYLHVCNYHRRNQSNGVWIMEEYGSWMLMFRFTQDIVRYYPFIARSKEGRHHLLLDYRGLYWYDQRDNTKEYFRLEALPRGGLSAIICIASLVPIPGCSSTKLQEITD